MGEIFRKIAQKEIQIPIVHEDSHFMAFNDINPQAETHVLVIPKKYAKDLRDMDHNDVGPLFNFVRDTAKKLGFTDYRIITNVGPGAGQTVFYVHVHLLAGDALTKNFKPTWDGKEGEIMFEKIVSGHGDRPILAENAGFVAFDNKHPVAEVHKLAIPKRKVATLKDLADSEIGPFFNFIREVAEPLSDYRVMVNIGPKGGQTVFYLHGHIISGAKVKSERMVV